MDPQDPSVALRARLERQRTGSAASSGFWAWSHGDKQETRYESLYSGWTGSIRPRTIHASGKPSRAQFMSLEHDEKEYGKSVFTLTSPRGLNEDEKALALDTLYQCVRQYLPSVNPTFKIDAEVIAAFNKAARVVLGDLNDTRITVFFPLPNVLHFEKRTGFSWLPTTKVGGECRVQGQRYTATVNDVFIQFGNRMDTEGRMANVNFDSAVIPVIQTRAWTLGRPNPLINRELDALFRVPFFLPIAQTKDDLVIESIRGLQEVCKRNVSIKIIDTTRKGYPSISTLSVERR